MPAAMTAAKLSRRRARIIPTCGMALLLCVANTAFAHGAGEEPPTLGPVTSEGNGGEAGMFVSEPLRRSLETIRGLMEKNQFKEALARLEALDARSDSYNRFENAVLHQTLGYAYASNNDYPKSAEAFEEALSFKALPKEATLAVMQNLGQLYIATEQYDKGIATLESWMNQGSGTAVPAALRVLLGNAYLHKQNYSKAAAQLKTAIASSEHPEKIWLQLLAASYQQWSHYAEMAEVLQQAVTLYPEEKTLWQQLVTAYRQLGDDRKATAALALSCDAGLCQTEDIIYLARMQLYIGAPMQAARLVEAALHDGRLPQQVDNWMLLAQSWQQARETDKAAAAYIEASNHSKTSGDADFRLGQIYVQQEKWQSAAAALADALKRGGLSSPGRAQLMLGVSHYYLGHNDQALEAIQAAIRYPDVEKEARRWLQQLQGSPAAASGKG